jgi:hypothetical protein
MLQDIPKKSSCGLHEPTSSDSSSEHCSQKKNAIIARSSSSRAKTRFKAEKEAVSESSFGEGTEPPERTIAWRRQLRIFPFIGERCAQRMRP